MSYSNTYSPKTKDRMGGIRAFYDVLNEIKNAMLDDPLVTTITSGDITRIDLSKQTIFPLSHVIVNSVTIDDAVLRFNVSVLAMDVVNVSKDETTDLFVGNDNEQDVLNASLAVLNRLTQRLANGQLYRDKYQLDGSISVEPFTDRFENTLAGMVATFDVLLQNDIKSCDI